MKISSFFPDKGDGAISLEPQGTYWRRVKYHVNYFVPAFIALFPAFPETHSLFSLDRLVLNGGHELAESLGTLLFFFLAYCAVHLIPGKLGIKTGLICILNVVVFSVGLGRIRGESPLGGIVGYLFESSAFAMYLPVFLLNFALIALDSVKASRRTIGFLYFVVLLFGIKGILSRNVNGVWDVVIAKDVHERILQSDYDSENEIIAECSKMSLERNRSRCIDSIAQKAGVPFCPWEEESDRSGCLAQVAEAKIVTATLQRCEKSESAEEVNNCYDRFFYSITNPNACEQLGKRDWVIACQKSLAAKSKPADSNETIRATISH